MAGKEPHPSNWKFRLWYWAIMLLLFLPFGAMGPLGWIVWLVLLALTDPIVKGLLRLIGHAQGYRVNFDGPTEETTHEGAAEVAAKSRDEINTAIATAVNWTDARTKELREKHLPADKEQLQQVVAKTTEDLKKGALGAFAWSKARIEEIEKKRQQLQSDQDKHK